MEVHSFWGYTGFWRLAYKITKLQVVYFAEIWVSASCVTEDLGLQGCDAVSLCDAHIPKGLNP